MSLFDNPFRPGAGHMPPYLAGRDKEKTQFAKLLEQTVITDNLILTGLRGVGKTVLLESLKPLAIQNKWLWAGTDLSESVSVSEEKLALRVITDLAPITSQLNLNIVHTLPGLRVREEKTTRPLDFNFWVEMFESTPGLVSDKLKAILENAWAALKTTGFKGVVFAYDEAQNLSDKRDRNEYPLSLLLESFQSVQRKGIPFLLVLSGLPTLFPKLIDARTYAERMFQVMHLKRLSKPDSRVAITKPIESKACPVQLHKTSIEAIIQVSGGYPYFIQFICREVYDLVLTELSKGSQNLTLPIEQITRKLDGDFFAGRWARATERQKELLTVVAFLDESDSEHDREFTVQEIVEKSLEGSVSKKPFSPSQAGQILAKLVDIGLVYKDRHGCYLLAVPLLGRFIRRQYMQALKRGSRESLPAVTSQKRRGAETT